VPRSGRAAARRAAGRLTSPVHLPPDSEGSTRRAVSLALMGQPVKVRERRSDECGLRNQSPVKTLSCGPYRTLVTDVVSEYGRLCGSVVTRFGKY